MQKEKRHDDTTTTTTTQKKNRCLVRIVWRIIIFHSTPLVSSTHNECIYCTALHCTALCSQQQHLHDVIIFVVVVGVVLYYLTTMSASSSSFANQSRCKFIVGSSCRYFLNNRISIRIAYQSRASTMIRFRALSNKVVVAAAAATATATTTGGSIATGM